MYLGSYHFEKDQYQKIVTIPWFVNNDELPEGLESLTLAIGEYRTPGSENRLENPNTMVNEIYNENLDFFVGETTKLYIVDNDIYWNPSFPDKSSNENITIQTRTNYPDDVFYTHPITQNRDSGPLTLELNKNEDDVYRIGKTYIDLVPGFASGSERTSTSVEYFENLAATWNDKYERYGREILISGSNQSRFTGIKYEDEIFNVSHLVSASQGNTLTISLHDNTQLFYAITSPGLHDVIFFTGDPPEWIP